MIFPLLLNTIVYAAPIYIEYNLYLCHRINTKTMIYKFKTSTSAIKMLFAFAGLFISASAVNAQTGNEWKDPQINQEGRLPMHTSFFAYENQDAAQVGAMEKSANYLSLEGIWKFKWVEDADQRNAGRIPYGPFDSKKAVVAIGPEPDLRNLSNARSRSLR